MFSSTLGFPLLLRPRFLAGRGANASSLPLAAADPDPPVQLLTPRQIRSVSANWKARGHAGDETALRVAEALEWLADHRAGEASRSRKTLAGRISAWMGLTH